jgi:hypothetical protein
MSKCKIQGFASEEVFKACKRAVAVKFFYVIQIFGISCASFSFDPCTVFAFFQSVHTLKEQSFSGCKTPVYSLCRTSLVLEISELLTIAA